VADDSTLNRFLICGGRRSAAISCSSVEVTMTNPELFIICMTSLRSNRWPFLNHAGHFDLQERKMIFHRSGVYGNAPEPHTTSRNPSLAVAGCCCFHRHTCCGAICETKKAPAFAGASHSGPGTRATVGGAHTAPAGSFGKGVASRMRARIPTRGRGTRLWQSSKVPRQQ
jgi:hypothetical protein